MMRRSHARAKEVLADDAWSDALVHVSAADPELELLRRRYAPAFTAALRDAVASLEARLRTVLRMSFVDAMTIDDIGATYGVHRATAARWIQRACDDVLAQTRRLLAERVDLSATEIAALVHSQLELSLSQLLPT
jgi:RNA polymerase sigma-70 factor (ECF subfamily)